LPNAKVQSDPCADRAPTPIWRQRRGSVGISTGGGGARRPEKGTIFAHEIVLSPA